tara:strand:- start:907 stop:1467 length:561 start_codon:yes stop_codon:yes gene_type:complete
MALKATIHRANISFSDLDLNRYGDHSLTIARHPSETDERMMIRLLAFVLNAPDTSDGGTLEFGKDLWEADEPALYQKDLTGLMVHLIEVGQPEEKRITRVCSRSRRVSVYCFSATAEAWWAGMSGRMSRMSNLNVWQIPPDQSRALSELADRSMNLNITIQEGTIWVEEGDQSVEVTPVRLLGGES